MEATWQRFFSIEAVLILFEIGIVWELKKCLL